MQTKIFINDSLAAILTKPEQSSGKVPIVLFLHGFGTDKNEVANSFEIAANKLLKQNIGSLRIDFSGFGESKGDASNITIDNLLANAETALNYIMKLDYLDITKIGLCGFSLGGGISVLISNEKNSEIKSMALLSPAGNLSEDFMGYFGKKDYEELEKLDGDTELDIDLGWRRIKLKNKFIHSFKNYFLMDSITKFKGSFFVIAGEKDFSFKHAKDYIKNSISKNKKLLTLPGQDHIFNAFEESSAIDKVTDEITNWFKQTL